MPQAENLLEMANEATFLADYFVIGFSPALSVLQTDSSMEEKLPQLIQIVDQNENRLIEAQPVVNQLLGRYELLKQDPAAVAALPDEIESLMIQIEPFEPYFEHVLPLSTVAPELVGSDRPKTYLIIAQNHDELRATGGFISGVGLLSIDQGNMGDLAFQDAYSVDDFGKPYDLPPQPIEQFMGVQLLVFRDANYWPNFPTSAEKMMELFTYGTGIEVDGVIALDQAFLASLVTAIEPITVEGIDGTITSANVDAFLQSAWETGDPSDENWFATRKSFLGPVSNAILNRMLNSPSEIDPVNFANQVLGSIQSGHLMFYTRDS